VYVLLSTYTALRLSQICGGLCQTRKTPTLAPSLKVAGGHTLPFLNWQTTPF
jgi:hypothetical protein